MWMSQFNCPFSHFVTILRLHLTVIFQFGRYSLAASHFCCISPKTNKLLDFRGMPKEIMCPRQCC